MAAEEGGRGDWVGRFSSGLALPLGPLLGVNADVLGRAFDHQLAAAGPRLGAHVDHPVSRSNHLEVVLDYQDRVARLDQPLKHMQQLFDVGKV